MSRERLAWPDNAKAIAILLVVLYHVAGRGGEDLLTAPGLEGLWWKASAALVPVRMPLFFLVSGVLAVSALQRPWLPLLRPRVLNLLWPFLLWTCVYGAVNIGGKLLVGSDSVRDAVETAATQLVFVGGPYWYLTALVAFFVVSKVLDRVPILHLVVALAGYTAYVTGLADLHGLVHPSLEFTLEAWITFFAWFTLGVRARGAVAWIAERNGAAALVSGVLFLGLTSVAARQEITVTPLLTVTGLVATLIVSRLIARSDRVRRAGREIAGRTLPIYVFHPLLILVFAGLAPAELREPVFRDPVLVPVAAVLLTVLSILIHRALMPRAPWLFRFPGASRAGQPDRVTARTG